MTQVTLVGAVWVSPQPFRGADTKISNDKGSFAGAKGKTQA